MGKLVDNSVLDGALDVIATATELYIVDTEPADRAACITANLLSSAAVCSGGDFTKADDASGRKTTFGGKSDLSIGTDGTARHVVLCTASTMLLVTTCNPQGLNSGGTVSVPSFVYNAQDPV